MAKSVGDALARKATALPSTLEMERLRISITLSDKDSDNFLETLSQSRSEMALLYDSIKGSEIEEKPKQTPKSLTERLALQLKDLEENDNEAISGKNVKTEVALKMANMLSNVGKREQAELRRKLEKGKEKERQMMDQYLESIGAVRKQVGEIAPYARAVVQPLSENQVQEYFNNSLMDSAVNIESDDIGSEMDIVADRLGITKNVTSESIGEEQNRLIDQYKFQQDQMKEAQRRIKEKVESRMHAAKEEKHENENKAINETLKISKEQESRFDEQRSRQEDQVKRMLKEQKRKKMRHVEEQNDEFLVAETTVDETGFIDNVTIVDETLTERLDPLGASSSEIFSEEREIPVRKRKNKKAKQQDLEISDLD